MIKLITTLILSTLLLVGCGKTGTQPPPVSDVFITAAVSAGTSAGLKLSIQDAARRTVIAGYLNNYAGALRTISGNPSDSDLTRQLNAFVPPDIQSNYPELASFAVPLVVSFYDWAKNKYGNDDAQVYKIINDVATGIEQGSACCTH